MPSRRAPLFACLALGSPWFRLAVAAEEPTPCEQPTTAADLQQEIDRYSTYAASPMVTVHEAGLRALAVDRALECLGEVLTPSQAGDLHRHRALRYFLARPPGLGMVISKWPSENQVQLGRIFDAACEADGPKPYDDDAWLNSQLNDLAVGRSCPAPTETLVPRPAREVVLLNGQPAETVLAPRRASPETPLPVVLQRVDRAGEVVSAAWLDAGTQWPPWKLRSRQAGPLALLGVGTTMAATGAALMALSVPLRSQYCDWVHPHPGVVHDSCVDVDPERRGSAAYASRVAAGAGAGAMVTGIGLITGGAVWLRADPRGVGLGLTVPVR